MRWKALLQWIERGIDKLAKNLRNTQQKAKLNCPFCNQDFEPEDILFCDEEEQLVPNENYDPVHRKFLESIIQYNQVVDDSGNRIILRNRQKYYFHPWSDKNRQGKPFNKPINIKMGEGGVPERLTIYRANGLTPARENSVINQETREESSPVPVDENLYGDYYSGSAQQSTEEDLPFSPEVSFVLTTKACPKCHCYLPDDIGKYPLFRITILGSTRAGKTTYMTMAAHQLENLNVGMPAGLIQRFSMSKDSKRYFDYLRECLKVGKLEATPLLMSNGVRVVFPIVSTIYPEGKNQQPFILAINDCPGEAMVQGAFLDNFYALGSMDGAMMIIDPSQFSSEIYDIEDATQEEIAQRTRCEVAFNNTLSEFVSRLGDMKKLRYIAFTLAKLDLVYGRNNKIQPQQYDKIDEHDIKKQHQNGFDFEFVDNLNLQVNDAISSKLLYEDYSCKVNSIIEKTNGSVSAKSLCCSTYSWNPVSEKFIPPVGVNQNGYRMLEPILYLLASAALLPVHSTNGGGSSLWSRLFRRKSD